MTSAIRFSPSVFLCVILMASFCPRTTEAQSSSESDFETHALLVGVTAYPNLSTKSNPCDLFGPAKDVVIMADTLKQFDAKITTLSEAAGKESHPIFANIRREFERLATSVKDGDQVLILFAGHGERSLNENPETDPEVDGMDEVFLARDASFKSGVFTNVVTDDQLNLWLTRIRNAGATVMFISDSCHSDTQTRGDLDFDADGPTTRGLDLSADYVPTIPGNQNNNENSNSLVDLSEESGSLIAFFAARNKEKTPDRFRVPGGSKMERIGLLTYTICNILNEYPGLTYRELGQRIKQKYDYFRYVGISAMVPHPSSSGTDLDRVVLGNKWKLGRSRLMFEVKGDIRISGGLIDGLTKDTILKLLPQSGEGEQTLGWAIVDKVESRDSVARLVDFDPATGSWQQRISIPESLARGRCEIESIQFEGRKLAVDLVANVPGYLDDDLKQRYQALVSKLKEESKKSTSPFALTSTGEAEFLLTLRPIRDPNRAMKAELELRTRGKHKFRPAAVFHFGPVDEQAFERILNRFLRISRAKRLLELASQFAGRSSSAANAVRFSVTPEIADQAEGPYAELASDDGTIPVGKYVRFRVRNYSKRNIQVTLLYVTDDFGIQPLLPSDDDEVNEIPAMKDGKPGEKLVAEGSQLTIASRRPESVLAIATGKESLAANSDYTYLRQAPLPACWMGSSQVQESGDRGGWESRSQSRGADSPLKYLDQIGFNPSQRSGMSAAKVPDHAFSVLNFTSVEPAPTRSKFDITKSVERVAEGAWQPEVAESSGRGFGETVFPKVAPSVVVVRIGRSHGTGFLVSDDGWVVTNQHVVGTAEPDPETGRMSARIYVGDLKSDGFMQLDEEFLLADIYKVDAGKDLALLKIRNESGDKQFKPLKLADKPGTPGTDCVAIGHPAAGALWLLRSGEIQGASNWPMDQMDNLLTRLRIQNNDRKDFIRKLSAMPSKRVVISSCGCNPGDSGGPLVNGDGEVVAVTFATPLIDVERKISLDEFSYHIDLQELKQFLGDKPKRPIVSPPDPWGAIDEFKLTTLSNFDSADTLAGVYEFSVDEADVTLAIDLDRDSPKESYRNKPLEEVRKVWDHEFMITLSMSRGFVAASYDTDNNGEIDLVRQKIEDREGFKVWRLQNDGAWQLNKEDGEFELFYYAPLSSKFKARGQTVFEECQRSVEAIFESVGEEE